METETGRIKPLIFSMIIALLVVSLASMIIARSQTSVVGKAFATGFIKSTELVKSIDWLSSQAFVWYGIMLIIGLLCALGIGYIVHIERRIHNVFEKFHKTDQAEKLSDDDKKAISDAQDYIKQMISLNYSKEQITKLLLQSEWDQKTIDSIFKKLEIGKQRWRYEKTKDY